MPAVLIDLIVVLAIAFSGFLGLSRGFQEAVIAGLEVLAALVLAVLAHEFLAGVLGQLFLDAFGPFLPTDLPVQRWAVFLFFSAVFWGMLAVLVKYVHPLSAGAAIGPTPLIDRIGGALAGAFSGSLFVGAVLLTWSMCPLLSGIPVPAGGMFFDVGRGALRAAGRFAGTPWPTAWQAVLDGEPLSRQDDPAALLSSESWRDRDDNGTFNDEEPFCDSDRSGAFTADLYYIDLDGDSARRVGMIEKYVVGSWDSRLRVNNRDRSAANPGQPAARPVPVRQPPQPPRPQPATQPAPVPAATPTPAPTPKPTPKSVTTPPPAADAEPKPEPIDEF